MGEGDYVVRTVIRSADAGYSAILASDPNRVAVLFSMIDTTVDVLVATNVGSANQFTIRLPASGYLEFTYSRHGPLPSQSWSVSSSFGGIQVCAVEICVLPTRRPAPRRKG